MSENEQLKSIVTSYRVSPDTKEKIKNQLDNLGLTQEQYFNKVVGIMELENIKQNNLFAVNTTELQDLTQRIYNIFINLCEQGNSFLSNKDTELEELKLKYKDMLLNKDNSITELKQELQNVYNNISVLQNENIEHKNELLNMKNEYNKQIEQLQTNLADKTSLINEYKTKNDDLISIVSEYKQYKVEVDRLNELLSDVKDINLELSNANKDLENKLNITNMNFEQMEINYKKEIDRINNDLNDKLDEKINAIELLKADLIKEKDDSVKILEQKEIKHKKELDMQLGILKEHLSIEKDKELIGLERKYQEQINKLNDSNNDKIKMYLDKIEGLQDELKSMSENKVKL